jgi:hypothetical protein
MTTNTKSKIKSIVITLVLTAVIVTAITLILIRPQASNITTGAAPESPGFEAGIAQEPMMAGVDEEISIITTDKELKAGRYYLNGDTDSHYFEVFSDKTIGLFGIDPLEYYYSFESSDNTADAASAYERAMASPCPETIIYLAEGLTARRNYVVLEIMPWGKMMINTYVGERPPEGFFTGPILIDSETIRDGADRYFTFVAQ